jgi:hypothetical protein
MDNFLGLEYTEYVSSLICQTLMYNEFSYVIHTLFNSVYD